MKTLRRTVFIIALLVIMVCAGLLITAYDPSNPAHRRYSSEVVLGTGQAPSEKIGADGERVLGKDLALSNNNKRNPRKIVCNTRYENQPPPENNTECVVFSDEIKNYRIPDFVSNDFIAESKNVKDLLVTHERDFQQITEIAIAAKTLNKPFWLYVRQTTKVSPEYYTLLDDIQGGIIHYFQTTEPYVDPIDFNLWQIIAIALGAMVVVLTWELLAKVFAFFTPTPKSSVAISPHKTSRKAKQSVDDYDRFMRNAHDNARKTLDD